MRLVPTLVDDAPGAKGVVVEDVEAVEREERTWRVNVTVKGILVRA